MPTKKKPLKPKKQADRSLTFTAVFFGFLILSIGLLAFFLASERKTVPFCANTISCVKNLSGKPEKNRNGIFLGRATQAPNVPETPKDEIAQERAVLGDTSANNKHIYVDLAHQRLTAYEGNTLFMDVPVSTGKWHPTPTGDFHIWIWLRATRMTGGSGAGYYDLPNVPFTMYFSNSYIPKSEGYSLHGAYWHNNFGHPMSHGCVNMIIADAEKLFYWSNSSIQGWTTYATDDSPGPMITIYGQAPANEVSFTD